MELCPHRGKTCGFSSRRIIRFTSLSLLEVMMSFLNKFRTNDGKKKTFGTWDNEFGLDNYCYPGSREEIGEKIIQDIQNNLERFEKRIQVVEIKPITNENPLCYTFQIKCIIEEIVHFLILSFHHHTKSFNVEAKL